MSTDVPSAPWGIPQASIESALATVERHFTRQWLTQTPIMSPLQQLWQRDELESRLELHWLGSALERLEPIDRAWLADQVHKARGTDANNRRGAIFEIVGLAMFAGEGRELVPAPRNMRGYDGHLTFEDNAKVLLSIKSLGRTRYAREVDELGMRTLQNVRAHADGRGVPWFGVLIEATKYITKEDWLRLERTLCANIQNGHTRTPLVQQADPWNILWQPQPDWISKQIVSSQMTVIVPFHQNEIRIYHDKLEQQIGKVGQQLAGQHANAAIVCARVDDSASIPDLESWAEDYLERHRHGPVDELFFYQPAMLIEREKTSLSHYIGQFARPQLQRPALRLGVPAGIRLTKPSYVRLNSGEPVTDRYIFQCGDLYRSVGMEAGLPVEANLGVTGMNIRVHAALESGGESAILSSKQSGRGQLQLFE